MANAIRPAGKFGLIGGLAAWHLCLVGMFETFAKRKLIGETITMGYVLLFALMIVFALVSAQQTTKKGLAIVQGTLAGSIVGLALAGLALLTTSTQLGTIFSFATPQLVNLLTLKFGTNQMVGLTMPVLGGIAAGILGSILAIIPKLWQRVIIFALVTTLLIALLRDVIAVLLPESIRDFLFTNSGLTLTGATLVFIVVGILFWLQSTYKITFRSSQVTASTIVFADQKHRSWQWWLGMGIFTLFLLTFPQWSNAFLSNVAVTVGLYIMMGMGLNLVIGFAGMLDLGFVAFYAIGAYTMAILTSPDMGARLFDLPPGTGLLTFWEAIPFSVLFAMIGGAILALPILKMRGDYLAIATLGFGEIIRILLLSNWLKPYTGGAQGITLIARPEIGNLVIKDPQQFYYFVLVGCCIAWFVGSRLKHSRLGRAWMAIREDEDVAQAMGINRVMVKLSAFVIGAFMGGLSGGIFASFVGSVVPRSFELIISVNVLALIIVGGMGSLPGIVVGAFVIVGLPELLREFQEYRLLVYGAVIALMMLYRPQGLWPEDVVAREMEEAKEHNHLPLEMEST